MLNDVDSDARAPRFKLFDCGRAKSIRRYETHPFAVLLFLLRNVSKCRWFPYAVYPHENHDPRTLRIPGPIRLVPTRRGQHADNLSLQTIRKFYVSGPGSMIMLARNR